MNKHIELVKKWLNDPESVTKEELKANRDAAYIHYDPNEVTAYAARAASADYDATLYMACAYYTDATYWVKRYEELGE